MNRYKEVLPYFSYIKLRPFSALRQKWKEGYTLSDFRADLLAGVVVGLVAIPLGMALAIASGVAPQYGLYTVIIAGGAVALLGGSRFQVTGPTAAFVVILAPIAQKFGFAGLLVAGLMAGILLVLMGMARMGRFIQFIPHPVTTGFTAGIAVVIATLQLKDFFGLRIHEMPENYVGRVWAILRALGSWSPPEFLIGAFTLSLLLIWPKINKKIPAPLIALTAAAVLTAIIQRLFPSIQISTIGSRFTFISHGDVIRGIPQTPPHFGLPWNFPGPQGARLSLSLDTLGLLVPPAFTIAMLGAIESLLSAVVADGMAQTKHDPDSELIAVGTGNILCPFFGGIAATGAIARTATNIRFGARSPLSAVIHAGFTLLVVLLFAPYVSALPMAGLAALLMLVAYNMSEVKHFFHILKVAPRGDVIVLLLCFFLTVIFDMVVGVTVGVVLAALLFMKHMAQITHGEPLPDTAPDVPPHEPLPRQAVLYRIAGPLFFGATGNAVDAISGITDDVKIVIFLMEDVPAMDVTGLVAFESAIKKLTIHKRRVILAAVQEQPAELLKKSGLLSDQKSVLVARTLDESIQLAKVELAG